MSDFFSNGWSIFIAVATVVSIVACLALLYIASKRKVMASDNTTGHVWDEDLRELNNPLPMWWVGLFVGTALFAMGYLLFYPGLGSYAGQWGWSQASQYQAEVDEASAQLAPLYAKFDAQGVEQLASDPQAVRVGERLFVNSCAQCHGSDARGSKGFPDLTDNDWLHGGSFEQVIESITKGRTGTMPPMAAAVGSAEDVKDVANFVLSLSDSPHNSIAAYKGKARFAACAACHGVGGRGNQALGAPNLADEVWLHGWGEQAVMDMINQGKVNQMPAHGDKLTASQIRVLAGYVWSLSSRGASVTSAAATVAVPASAVAPAVAKAAK